MGRLDNKKAVVTGGSNGIGRAIVEAFIQEGADVFFTTLNDIRRAQEIVDAYPEDRVGFIKMNATEFDSVARLFDEATGFLESVDILVNNAAGITRTGFLDLTLEEYEFVMNTNARFPFFATQVFAKHMVEKGTQGSIINISSVSSFSAISKMAHYQCSKASLTMLSKSAAYELAQYGIRVNTISPGLTATKANRNQWEGNPGLWAERSQGIPLSRTGKPQDHAGAAVFLASDESSWVTGIDVIIDGGRSVV